MQNIKLLDLETGKYLEVGKGWLYGEMFVVVNKLTNGGGSDFDKHYKTEPQEPLKAFCEKTGAVVYGNRYVLLNEIDVWVYNNNLPQKK